MKLDFEAWRAVAEPFYEVYRKRPVEIAGAEVEATVAGDLLLSRVSMAEQILVHDPLSRRSICHDYLLFERFHRGGGIGEVGDIGFCAHPTRLHLIDMSRRYVSSKGASRSEGVLIPHSVLAYDPSVDPAFATLEIASPQGRLLANAHALLTLRPDVAEIDDLVAAFVSMVERFMLGRSGGERVRECAADALAFTLRSHIEAGLGDSTLTPDALCVAFGISRSALYRHFEEDGGVSRYIRNRRLNRCLLELAGGPPTRGRISAVARRWGFVDQNAFLRQFKKRFGVPPSECLAGGAAPNPAPDGPSPLSRTIAGWLDGLPHR
ncbi:MAG: helix-turn-helix domain-containing protein [Pseudomonadota bacterium]